MSRVYFFFGAGQEKPRTQFGARARKNAPPPPSEAWLSSTGRSPDLRSHALRPPSPAGWLRALVTVTVAGAVRDFHAVPVLMLFPARGGKTRNLVPRKLYYREKCPVKRKFYPYPKATLVEHFKLAVFAIFVQFVACSRIYYNCAPSRANLSENSRAKSRAFYKPTSTHILCFSIKCVLLGLPSGKKIVRKLS